MSDIFLYPVLTSITVIFPLRSFSITSTSDDALLPLSSLPNTLSPKSSISNPKAINLSLNSAKFYTILIICSFLAYSPSMLIGLPNIISLTSCLNILP
nr:MAG TPA: hypothetical protein [Crassvirales sp.]